MKPTKLEEEIKRRELINSYSPFPVYDTEIINDLKKREEMISRKSDFNNVPVEYCKTCLSLKLKTVEFENSEAGENRDVTYCVPCGNTELGTAHIEEWEDLYEEKYGEKFIKLPEDD